MQPDPAYYPTPIPEFVASGGTNNPLARHGNRKFPTIQQNTHAVTKHGDDAIMARMCMDSHGVVEVWRANITKDLKHDTFFLLCLDMDGNVYTQIITRIKRLLYRESTAFRYVRYDGRAMRWSEAIQQLISRGATKYTGPLP